MSAACPFGHSLEGVNLVPANLRNGQRACLACSRARAWARRTKEPLTQALRDAYYVAIRDGVPVAHRRSAEQRFWPRVEVGDCWVWLGAIDRDGYGQFWHETRMHRAHRWAFEALVGPIPTGLELDHLCRNPPCVNPDHLEPVTHEENLARRPRYAAAA